MKKRKIVIATSIIGFVLLAVISFSYAYITLRVLGNNKAKGVERTVASGATVLFNDLTTKNNGVISPGYTTYMKFTVQNTGNSNATYYIYLVDVVNTFTRKQDIVYTLYRKEGENSLDEGEVSNCSNISGCETLTTGEFPSEKKQIGYSQSIYGKYNSYTYVLKIEYKKSTENQDEDQGHIFGGRIEVSGSGVTNPFSKGTLANAIYSSAESATNGTSLNTTTSTTFTGVSSSTEKNLRIAYDDYGKTYYYRGAVTDNYVSFAGFTWRIMRINGDGSIRLVLDGLTSRTYYNGTLRTNLGTNNNFNSLYNANKYVGYMYDSTSSDANATVTKSSVSSLLKQSIDTFYINYLSSYESYLSDEIYCGDRSLNSGTGIATTTTNYGVVGRMNNNTPTYKCPQKNDRYTVNDTTLGNGALTYPIATLTYDDLFFAGAYKFTSNTSYYLYNSLVSTERYFQTMTPQKYTAPTDLFMVYSEPSWSIGGGNLKDNIGRGVRPVINFKPGIEVLSGDGTKSNPYKVSGYDLN